MEGESCYSHVTDVASLKKGEWLLQEVDSLMEGELFCYKGGLFNGGQMVMLERRPV